MNSNKIALGLILFLMICFNNVSAQREPLDTLVNKLNTYYNNTLGEKIFLHTDRSTYLTGEIIWFKIYYVDASFHRPIHVSKIAYLELIDKDNVAVLQTKIDLKENSSGSSSVFLPTSINSGNYVLRVYTNWMKNFSADAYYQQQIKIINPFTSIEKKIATNTPLYDAQFFAEGGSLVKGLKSKVAFRVVDQNGKGIKFKGLVLNENNDTLISFSPLVYGLGHFFVTPTDNNHKVIIIDNQGHQFSYKLPQVSDEGYVMTLDDSTIENKIMVTVNTKANQFNYGKSIYLLAHTREKILTTRVQTLNEHGTSFVIDKKLLGEGISHITVFNDKLIPVCERLWFKRSLKNNIKIDLAANQSLYSLRRKVTLNISVINAHSLPDMSMAVFKLDSLQDDAVNIKDYLLLTSELVGRIESPSYYLSDTAKSEAIDNVMLTYGWSRFKWQELSNESKKIKFMPELEGHVINGVVTNLSGYPLPGIATYLTTPNKVARLYTSKSDVNGKIKYEMRNFFDSQEIIVSSNTTQDSTHKINILSPYTQSVSNYKLSIFDFPESLSEKLQQRSVHMQVQNAFYEKQINWFVTNSIDSVGFYGKPDEKYLLDKYTRFPTMEEVMREYVPGVMVRKRQNKFHFLNLDTQNNTFFKDDPLVLIDGMPVFDVDKIMQFDPRKIKKLDVVTQRYFLGSISFEGIVSFSTYSGDLDSFQPDSKSLIMSYEGLQSQREFFNPRYETQQQRSSKMPDTRHLLYWSPSVKTDNSGKGQVEFYTSDIPGTYSVVVQGLTKTGEPVYSTYTFEVKDSSSY